MMNDDECQNQIHSIQSTNHNSFNHDHLNEELKGQARRERGRRSSIANSSNHDQTSSIHKQASKQAINQSNKTKQNQTQTFET